MSFELVVQTVVYQALSASAELTRLVTGVYDAVPQGQSFPYVSIGEDSHNEWDTVTTNGSDATITIHSWSRERGRMEIKQIQGAIYSALHNATVTHNGYRIESVQWLGSESFMDQDGLTRHGVSTFRVMLDKA